MPLYPERLRTTSSEWVTHTSESWRSYPHISGIIYEDLKPLLLAMKVSGVLPLTKLHTDKVEFRLVSVPMLYSAVMYLCLLGMWFGDAMKLWTSENRFDHLVDRISTISYFLLVICIPFTAWREASKFATCLNSWRRFEMQFYHTTNKTLKLGLFRRSVILLGVALVASLCLETSYAMLKSRFVVWRWITNTYQTFLRYLIGALFYVLCLAVARMAQTTISCLRLDLKNKSEVGFVIAKYRTLWLELNRLAQHVGSDYCFLFNLYLLYLFLNLTLCLYLTCTASRLFKSMVLNVETSVTSTFLLFMLCDAGHSVSKHVAEGFQEELIMIRTLAVKVSHEREVDEFLQIIRIQKPCINLGGYVTVNRKLIVTLGSSLVTYLIVLVQFQTQAEDTR